MSICIEGLSIDFQQNSILEDVSFTCEVNQLLAICGPNGAGKSTLLKAISGDLTTYDGGILFGDQNIRTFSAKAFAKRRAMMPQQVDMSFNFTAGEIIESGLYLTDDNTTRVAILHTVSQLLQLDDLLSQPCFQLSGGQKQRVQLARVIAQLYQFDAAEPRFLLLDECSSAMDIAMVHQVFNLLKHLATDQALNLGIVAVVHDLNIASLYADELVLLGDRRCQYKGTPERILTRQVIHEVFSTPVHILSHPDNGQPMVLPCASSHTV